MPVNLYHLCNKGHVS